MTGQAIEKYEEGFKYAKRQLRFLDPEFNVKTLGAYKRFVDGGLVGSDDSDSEEYESETDDEEPVASIPPKLTRVAVRWMLLKILPKPTSRLGMQMAQLMRKCSRMWFKRRPGMNPLIDSYFCCIVL